MDGQSNQVVLLDEKRVEAVLDELRAQRGLSFHQYRRSTIERRLTQRLAAIRADNIGSYVRILKEDPGEVDRLVAHLTLKVTGFFRNPLVFELLRKEVLPKLLALPTSVSIWSAGCATGEEVYSLAMAFAEHGPKRDQRRSIVGTDVDEAALAAAQSGRYSAAAVNDLPESVLERWFIAEETQRGCFFLVRDELREGIVFARHNLVDAPGPPPLEAGDGLFDLVLCRNVLIYFERPLQERVLTLVFESLRPWGYLVLGEDESLPSNIESRCRCIDRRSRIYQRIGGS